MRPWNPKFRTWNLPADPGNWTRLLRQTVPVGAHCVSANWATKAGLGNHCKGENFCALEEMVPPFYIKRQQWDLYIILWKPVLNSFFIIHLTANLSDLAHYEHGQKMFIITTSIYFIVFTGVFTFIFRFCWFRILRTLGTVAPLV